MPTPSTEDTTRKGAPPDPARAPNEAEFDELADQERIGLATEFWEFLKYNKKWWLLPIVLVFLLLGVLVLLTSSAPAALPFIYTLF